MSTTESEIESAVAPTSSTPDDDEQEEILETTDFEFRGETIHFEIKANKQVYPIDFGSENTGLELKQYIEAFSTIPVANQKILFKGSDIRFSFLYDIAPSSRRSSSR